MTLEKVRTFYADNQEAVRAGIRGAVGGVAVVVAVAGGIDVVNRGMHAYEHFRDFPVGNTPVVDLYPGAGFPEQGGQLGSAPGIDPGMRQLLPGQTQS